MVKSRDTQFFTFSLFLDSLDVCLDILGGTLYSRETKREDLYVFMTLLAEADCKSCSQIHCKLQYVADSE